MSNFVGVRVLADGLSPCPNPLSRGAAIDPQTSSAHVVFTDLPDGVIREACILRKASICEHNIELALFSLDLGEEAIKIGDVRHLSLVLRLQYRFPLPLPPTPHYAARL